MPLPTEPEIDQEEPQEALHGQMSFLDHLEELRTRLINMLIATGISFAACWFFSDNIFKAVSAPIVEITGPLNFMAVTEPFNLTVKVAFIASLFIASPFIMAQIWLFVSPGLYKHERRSALPFILSSSLLFVSGGLFGYYVAFPFALEYLVLWGRDLGMNPVLSAREYFDLFVMIELGLGIVFEIPAVIFVLSRIGLVTPWFLLRNFKYAVLITFVVAAVITPSSDIPNLMVMAVPMLLLYLLGVIVAFLFGKKREKQPGD
jgi:sec-independent protein translocase protein TatC